MAVVPSYFGALAEGQNLQALIDNSIDALQNQSIWRKYLTVGIPSPTLTFESVIGRGRLAAAASIVDPDSKKPIRSRPKSEIYTGKIPSIQEKIPMKQADYRSLLAIEGLLAEGPRKQAFIKKLFDDVETAAVAVDKRVDIMLLQMLSTLQVDVSVTNNPDGVVYGVVDLISEPYQKQGVPVIWSDPAAKPIDDIETYVQLQWNTRGRKFSKMIMARENWIRFKNNAQVRSYLQTFYNVGKANASFVVSVDSINEYMVANGLPLIEVTDYAAGIEVDGIITPYKPFDANAVSFVQDGIIGELANAIAIEERTKATSKQYAMYGRTLISKWQENDPFLEWTGSELNAIPALDFDNIFILNTNTVQASFI